jgi:hypothetical protein
LVLEVVVAVGGDGGDGCAATIAAAAAEDTVAEDTVAEDGCIALPNAGWMNDILWPFVSASLSGEDS